MPSLKIHHGGISQNEFPETTLSRKIPKKSEQPKGCSDGIFRISKRFNRKHTTRGNILTPFPRSPAFPVSQWHIGVAPRYSCRYSPWITHGSFLRMFLFNFTGDPSMYIKNTTRRMRLQRLLRKKGAPPQTEIPLTASHIRR